MDPWGDHRSSSRSCDVVVQHQTISNSSEQHKFEDNFAPSLRDTLPHSEEYLAILEKKLRKLKSDTNVLRQLSEKREACMQNLLNGDPQYLEPQDEDLEAPLSFSDNSSSQILRTILLSNRRQPLYKGEVAEFVEYDQLQEQENSDTDSQNQEQQ